MNFPMQKFGLVIDVAQTLDAGWTMPVMTLAGRVNAQMKTAQAPVVWPTFSIAARMEQARTIRDTVIVWPKPAVTVAIQKDAQRHVSASLAMPMFSMKAFVRRNRAVASHLSSWAMGSNLKLHVVSYALKTQVPHKAVMPFTTQVSHVVVQALLGPSKVAHQTSYSLATRVVAAHGTTYDVKTTNPVRKQFNSLYALLNTSFTVITQDPFVTVNGERVDVLSGRVSMDEGNAFWTADLTLPDAVAWSRFTIGQVFTLDIYGETFLLMVDSRNRNIGDTGIDYSISAVSVGALLDEPYAQSITNTWGNDFAEAIVEAILGEAVDWNLVNWTIPEDKVSAVNSTPFQAADVIVRAAGGVIQSKPDGSLEVRHLYPVPVPEFYTATPDHTYTGLDDLFVVDETYNARPGKNRITLRNETARNAGYLSAQVDTRTAAQGGLNRTHDFIGGDTVWFLVFTGPFVTIKEIITSDGSVHEAQPQEVELEEIISFSDTDVTSTDRPVKTINEVTWFGTNLGPLTLSDDKMTLKAASSGVAMARIKYTAECKVYGLTAPELSGGEDVFPIKVYVVGTYNPPQMTTSVAGNMVVVTVVRGLGENPGDEIIEPLGTTASVLVSRGRAEIDSQESKYDVNLTAKHRSGVRLGQLIEVQDETNNEVWRGKIVGVDHQIEPGRVMSDLRVEKVIQ